MAVTPIGARRYADKRIADALSDAKLGFGFRLKLLSVLANEAAMSSGLNGEGSIAEFFEGQATAFENAACLVEHGELYGTEHDHSQFFDGVQIPDGARADDANYAAQTSYAAGYPE